MYMYVLKKKTIKLNMASFIEKFLINKKRKKEESKKVNCKMTLNKLLN